MKCLVFVSLWIRQVLICRNYKGDVDMSEIDHFFTLLMQQEEEGLLCPVMSHGSVHFLWIKHNNLYRILNVTETLWCSDDSHVSLIKKVFCTNTVKKFCSFMLLFLKRWACNVYVKLNTSVTSVVATTNKNSNASLVYSFLYKLVEVSWPRSSWVF